MQKIIYIQFISIFLLNFLNKYGLIPRQLTWIPDVMAAVILIIVVMTLVTKRNLNLHISYVAIFAILFLHALFSIILNEVPTGAVFQAIRNYFKYIPFFLLPIAYNFTDIEIKSQIKLLVALTFLQLPIAIYQRFYESANSASGDAVRGTFGTSSLLSIYLICAFSICLAFFLKKKLSVRKFIIFSIFLLLPTTLNETKGTLFLLPFGFLVPALITGNLNQKVKRLFLVSGIGIIFLGIFIPIYDSFVASSDRQSIVEFFTTENRLEGYLAPHTSGLRTNLPPGRVDIILNPFKELHEDPTQLMLGLGPGNVSTSFLGSKFSGDYLEKYGNQMYVAMSNLLWEFGVLGTLLTLILWGLILKDSLKLAKFDSFIGAFALGWVGAISVLVLSFFYKNIIQSDIISYLFWYFSGYIAAQSAKIMTVKYRDYSPRI